MQYAYSIEISIEIEYAYCILHIAICFFDIIRVKSKFKLSCGTFDVC